MVKNCGSQTLSIEEIFVDYGNQIKAMKQQLKGAAQRETNLMSELNRISDYLRDAKDSETKFKKIAIEAEDEMKALKETYRNADRTIRNLNDQIMASHVSVSNRDADIKQLKVQMENLRHNEKALKLKAEKL